MILNLGFIDLNAQNQNLVMVILNSSVKEQDTLSIMIANPSKKAYFLPIDFKHKGVFAEKTIKFSYNDKDTTSYKYFSKDYSSSFYPTIRITDSDHNIMGYKWWFSTDSSLMDENEYFFKKDTLNYFDDIRKMTLIKPFEIKVIQIPVKTKFYNYNVFDGEKIEYGSYDFEIDKKYYVSVEYHLKHCMGLEKRISHVLLEKLKNKGYKCYNKPLVTINEVNLIIHD